MKHTETELTQMKDSISEMWKLVQSQFSKSKKALITNNQDISRVVVSTEKRVNAFELKIDSDCENFIALYSPVAIDLRLVLSMLKINKTLERIGDFAEGIARFVISYPGNEQQIELLKKLKVEEMMNCVEQMLEKSNEAINSENSAIAGSVFSIDNKIDSDYAKGMNILAEHVTAHPEDALYCLNAVALLRKIERAGDHCNNIMEEIVFYLDAKVLKHQKK
jgi:phosphate transport system protein